MGDQPIDRWLSDLERLQPADGRLTRSILEAAGPLPLTEGVNRVFEVARVKAYIRTLLEYRINRYAVEAHDAERAGQPDEAAKLNAQSHYWKSVTRWVEQL
jgi:hypothetical protein